MKWQNRSKFTEVLSIVLRVLADFVVVLSSIALGLQAILIPNYLFSERIAIVIALIIWVRLRDKTTSVRAPNSIILLFRYLFPFLLLPLVVSSALQSLTEVYPEWVENFSASIKQNSTNTVIPTSGISPSPSATYTLFPTPTSTSSPTITASPTLTPTATLSPTSSPTPTVTKTYLPVMTLTAKAPHPPTQNQ